MALEAIAAASPSTLADHGPSVGYLIGQQNADGSWTDLASRSAVYTTAMVVRAIWPYRKVFNVAPAIDKARTYLLSLRSAGGLWAEDYESAIALLAIAPTLLDRSGIQGSVDALAARQGGDGSFWGDVYVTALALRALLASSVPSSDNIIIEGRMIDGDTAMPLSGGSVALAGPVSSSVTSDSSGMFRFAGLVPGTYGLTFSRSGYQTVSASSTVAAGNTVDFGDVTLLKTTSSSGGGGTPTTGTVRGTVTRDSDGQPIPGAIISIAGGPSTGSAADGSYLLANVASGNRTLSVSADGFQGITATASLPAGGFVVFSPRLSPNENAVGALYGSVTDASTGMPLAGAAVTVSGSTAASVTAGAAGDYRIDNLAPGDIQVQVSNSGYHDVIVNTRVGEGAQIPFSPVLYPLSETPPPNANSSSVTGTVLDSTTGQPLANARVVVRTTPITPHEWWRVRITAGKSTTVVAISDVRFHDRVDGVDLTTGGTAIADSTSSASFAAANAFDASSSTVWRSGAGFPHWIGYHFANPVRVTEYTVRPSAAHSTEQPTAWALQYSDDGVSWTDADSRSAQTFVSSNANVYLIGTQYQTDSAGVFQIDGIRVPEIELGFAQTGYESVELSVPVPLDRTEDIGQVRLRPSGLEQAAPDLIVPFVNAQGRTTTTDSLALSGSATATIKNVGDVVLSQPADVVAFYDANFDRQFDADVDVQLGAATFVLPLDPDQSATLELTLAGTVPFRDPPVSVVVNPNGHVLERSVENNYGTSGAECLSAPGIGAFTPKVKWTWTPPAERASYGGVLVAPAVAQLTDDNGDGDITTADMPDVIFTAFSGDEGYLTAARGDTGETIWQSAQLVEGFASPAVGDIDNDGLVEIVIPNAAGNQLLAYENTGALKWAVSSGYSSRTARDQLVIADLDKDGSPEIVMGTHVFSSSGQLLWAGVGDEGSNSYGSVPTVADVDLDGELNVIAGRTLYDADGNLLWTASATGDGYTAQGNFDSDPQAEIVLVTSGRVFLFNHDGSRIWGPVSITGGGSGGPPTIGDMDGDGSPEIGVAGSARYVVLRADGSIKWSSVTVDPSSHRTGSSVFDLDGDGRAEVLYADERYFRVYDGATGAVKFSIANTSGTVLELPVVADIDNDGHAEILFGRGNGQGGGLRALEGINDDWMPTRSIWNQHSYHISNVNDDGTIPRDEHPSWQSHNTYRLNTFLDRSPLAAPDLTASRLRVIDNGSSQPISMEVRIGNGGSIVNPEGATLSFYDGDPAGASFTLLGTVSVPALEPGRYVDLRLDNIATLSRTRPLFASVDSANVVAECNEANNTVSGPLVASMPLGDVSVASDAASYPPDAPVTFNTVSRNTGDIAGAYRLDVMVLDASGNEAFRFATTDLGILEGGQARPDTFVWPALGVWAGVYTARATMSGVDGTVVDVATTDFSIGSIAPGADAASVRITTDRPTYHTTGLAVLDNLARNLSGNSAIPEAALRVTVRSSGGALMLDQTVPLGELPANGLATRKVDFRFAGIAQGAYTAQAQLLDGAGQQRATSQTTFNVAEVTAKALFGTVAATQATLFRGETQSCQQSVSNGGTQAVEGVPVRLLSARLDVEGEPLVVSTRTLTLASGASTSFSDAFDTDAMNAGDHACILQAQAQADGDWKTLAYANYRLQEPALQVEGTVTVAEPEITVGEAQSCTDQVRNLGNFTVPELPVRQTLMRAGVSTPIQSEEQVLTLARLGSSTLTRSIATPNLEVGDYACVLEARIGGVWTLLDDGSFTVNPEPIRASLEVSTDKAVYNVTDETDLTTLTRSLMEYQAITGASLHLEITSPTGQVVFSRDEALADLAPGTSRSASFTHAYTNAAEGDYQVQARISSSDGAEIASAQAQYEARKTLLQALTGTVAVESTHVPRGTPQVCTDTLINGSRHPFSGVTARQSLRTGSGETLNSTTFTANLGASGTDVRTRSIDTVPLAVGDYACVLEAQVDGTWNTLDTKAFTVDPPPVRIDASMALGEKGRLLVLMDPPGAAPAPGTLCENDVLSLGLELDFDPPLAPDALVQVKVLNSLGLQVDVESVQLAEFDNEVNAHAGSIDLSIRDLNPNGLAFVLRGVDGLSLLGKNYRVITTISSAAQNLSFNSGLIDLACNTVYAVGDTVGNVFTVFGLGPLNLFNHNGNGIGDGTDVTSATVQRQFLEQLLTQEGWTYTITTTSDGFANEMRSGGYTAYALLSEYVVLKPQIQKELREAVYRGDGVLIAGRHDVRTRILDDAVGIKYKGWHLNAQGLDVQPSDLFVPGQATFGEGDRIQRVRRLGAEALAKVLPPDTTAHDTAVARHQYGDGKSVLAGFDVLAEANLAGLGSLMADVIRKPLAYVQPPQDTPQAGRVAPVRLTLQNQSIPVAGRVTVESSLGGYILSAKEGTVSGGRLTVEFNLAEGASKAVDFFVQLPPGGIPVTLTARVESYDGTIVYDQGSVTLAMTPMMPPGLDDAIAELQAYVSTQPQAGLVTQILDLVLDVRTPAKRALDHLVAADQALTNGDPVTGLTQMVEATDELIRDGTTAVVPIRKKVDHAILDAGGLQ